MRPEHRRLALILLALLALLSLLLFVTVPGKGLWHKALLDASHGPIFAAVTQHAKDSLFAVVNRQLWSDGTGNGSKDIGGIDLIGDTSPSTGTVGGINAATFSFWRNYQASAAKTSTIYDNLRSAMRTAYNTQSRGAYAEQPDYIVFDTTTFGGYEGTLIANERFTDKSSGEGGFKNEVLKFKGAKVLFDEDCPNATGFVLNSANLKFNYLQFAKASPSIEPANQFAEVVKVLTIGNMSINNSRRLGRLYSTQS